jgi:DNA polymerase-3 subunit alpha
MAFLTVEDLFGSIEILVFPNQYEANRRLLETDQKVFVTGRVSAEDEKDAKLICQSICSFDDTKKELWLQFENKEAYLGQERNLQRLIGTSDGKDEVIIYLTKEKAMKRLGPAWNVCANEVLKSALGAQFGENNVRIVEKGIEKRRKKN